MQIENIETQVAAATNECESASSYADDAKQAAHECEQHADNACGALSEIETDVESLKDECTEMSETISELETERDALRNESKLQTVVSELEKKLEFERARFQRVVSFIEAIAGESIVIDSTPPGES
jgi:chromosome segregation ATPase